MVENLGHFQLFVVMNNPAINIFIHVFLLVLYLEIGKIPRSGITEMNKMELKCIECLLLYVRH